MDNEAAQVPAQPIKVSVEDAGPQQGEGAGPGGGGRLCTPARPGPCGLPDPSGRTSQLIKTNDL